MSYINIVMEQEEFLNSVNFNELGHEEAFKIIKHIDEMVLEYGFTENLAKYALEVCIKCVKSDAEDFELLKNEIMSLFEKEF